MQDPVVVSFLVDFPLRVNHAGTSISIEEAATLQARFQEILPEVVRSDVLGQDPETFFCNWTGLMYGKGEIWIRATDQRYTVSAINLPLENESERSRTTPRLIFVCKADEQRAVIDTDAGGNTRYRAWTTPRSVTDEPDFEISSGTVDWEGTGLCAHPVWRFSKVDMEVTVISGACYPDSDLPPRGARGSLLVSVAGQKKEWWCY